MGSVKRSALIVALAVVASACGLFSESGGSFSEPPSTSSTTTTTSTLVTTVPPLDAGGDDLPDTADGTQDSVTITIDVTSCDEASTEFLPLCEAYKLLTTQFVDPLEPTVLAEAAVRGVDAFDPDSEAGSNEQVTCSIPDASFQDLCTVIARELATEATPVDILIETAILGMTEFGENDPNSSYIPESTLDRIQEERSGSIEGIGALVRAVDNSGDEEVLCTILSDTCRMVIVSPLDGSPAEAAGIQSGDAMVSVDGADVRGQTIDQIVSIVRGPSGTDVRLGLERDGEIFEVTITRAPIVIPVVESEMLDDNTGYVRLALFSSNSGGQVEEAIDDLLDLGATDLIFDLRGNPGGALSAAIDVASQFLDDGLVLITQSPDEETEYQVRGGGLLTDPGFPVVVLVDRGSASASEVVTGALQEAGRVTVMGENTFGKNTVQQEFPLSNGAAMKITIARWVTPGGLDFGGDGLTPDIPIAVDPAGDFELLRDEALALLNS